MRDFELLGADSPEEFRGRLAQVLVKMFDSSYLRGYKTYTKFRMGERYSTQESGGRESCMTIEVCMQGNWFSTWLRRRRVRQHFERICQAYRGLIVCRMQELVLGMGESHTHRIRSVLHIQVPQRDCFPRIPLVHQSGINQPTLAEFRTHGVVVHVDLNRIEVGKLVALNSMSKSIAQKSA
jgi:hypothetical protein